METQNIAVLERQVRELKEQERVDNINKELEKQTKTYKNKCYATHTFARKVNHSTYGGINACLRKVVDVYLKDNTVMLSIENISYRRNEPTGYLSFEVNQTTSRTARNWYENFRYEITLDQYEAVKQQVSARIDVISSDIRSTFRNPDQWQTMGSASDEESEVKLLLASKMPVIKLSDDRFPGSNITIKEILHWQRHPLIVAGEYLLNNKYSKLIIQEMIAQMSNHATAWGNSISERDWPRIQGLREFLYNTKWEE